MKRISMRFISLLVLFASIFSFIPLQMASNGQAVHAATEELNLIEATTINVTEGPNDTGAISGKNNLYQTKTQVESIYIVANDKRVDETSLIKIGDTGIIEQEIIIKSVNGINVNDVEKIRKMQLEIEDADLSSRGQIGKKLNYLPLGVNKIEYTVKVKTATRVPTPNFKSSDKDDQDTGIITYREQLGEYPILVIEHGNAVVQNQINAINFTNYIEGRDIDSTENITPFKYEKTVLTASDASLRYIDDIPVSVTDLDYTIKIAKGIFDRANGDKIYINGIESNDFETTLSDDGRFTLIKDSLTRTGKSTLVVLAINRPHSIQRSFSIEIQYNDQYSSADYTLRDIGITKYNYTKDKNVVAKIGKEFIEQIGDGNLQGIPIYSGTLTVNKLASMISMEPKIGRSSSETAYKIYNYYEGGMEPGQLKNGKIYVNFNKGLNNVIYLEVFEGKDGSATSNTPLAIYKFKVNIEGNESSDVDFEFNNGEILTQPGRKINEGIDFTSERRTYDLHSNNNEVKVDLVQPSTVNSVTDKRREYIKAWLGSSVESDSVRAYELPENSTSATIDVGGSKKLVLQAYYDDVIYEINEDGTPKLDENGDLIVKSKKSYPVGDKYTFYIAKNASGEHGGSSSEADLDNAFLSSINVKGGTIKSQEDGSGFLKDKLLYEVMLPKREEFATVTVITENPKAKDVSVVVVESGDNYGLESNEPFDFILNKSGRTTLEITVTAQDGNTKKTYTLTINNDTRSCSAVLKNIVTDHGDFTFDPFKDINKIRVDQQTKTLSVMPIPEEALAKVIIDGERFNGNSIEINLSGSQETDFEIEIVSEDGSEIKVYDFLVIRSNSPIEDGDDENDGDDIFYDDIDDCWVDTSKYDEWGSIKGKKVYFDRRGRQTKSAWITTDGKWYYLDSKGYKEAGWRKETADKMYYLDANTGELRMGWLHQNGRTYYLGLNGVMHRGWLYLNGSWYYFNKENGEMIINQSLFIDDKVYKFGFDGKVY